MKNMKIWNSAYSWKVLKKYLYDSVPVDSDDVESIINPGDEYDPNVASEEESDKMWSRHNNSFGSSQPSSQKLPSLPMPRKSVLTGYPTGSPTGSTGNLDAAWRLNSSFGNASSVSSFSPRSNSSTSSRNGGGSSSTASSNGSQGQRNLGENRKKGKSQENLEQEDEDKTPLQSESLLS